MRWVKFLCLKISNSKGEFLGTFVAYDTVNNINGPAVNGFAAGIYYKDNSTEYVGYGSFSTGICVSSSPSPGPVLINPPGAMMTCTSDTYDNNTSFYLLNHPSLTWVASNPSAMLTLPNTIKFNKSPYPFLFGRVFYNGAYQIGKIHAGNGLYGLYLGSASGVQSFTGSSVFEVLTCAA